MPYINARVKVMVKQQNRRNSHIQMKYSSAIGNCIVSWYGMHTEFSFAVRGRVQQNYIQTLTILKKTGTWWIGSHPVYGVDHPVAGAHVRLDNLGLDTASVNLVIKILVDVATMWSLWLT